MLALNFVAMERICRVCNNKFEVKESEKYSCDTCVEKRVNLIVESMKKTCCACGSKFELKLYEESEKCLCDTCLEKMANRYGRMCEGCGGVFFSNRTDSNVCEGCIRKKLQQHFDM